MMEKLRYGINVKFPIQQNLPFLWPFSIARVSYYFIAKHLGHYTNFFLDLAEEWWPLTTLHLGLNSPGV